MARKSDRASLRLLRALVQPSGAREYAVPDLQRDFLWSAAQVRSLAASVLAGYPIGSILLTKGILGSDRSRIGYQTLDRRTSSRPGVPYVLDGQQRLLALFAAFRRPGDLRSEKGWFSQQDALRGLWFVDLKVWLDAATSNEKRSFDDADVIERAVKRTPGMEVSESDSLKLLSAGYRIPLWLLVQLPGREPEKFAGWRDGVSQRLVRWAGSAQRRSTIDSIIQQISRVRLYCVPVSELPEISAPQAIAIFKRLNRSGCRLDGADLVFSQLTRFDATIRRDIRLLQRQLGSDRYRHLLPLAGLLQEDILHTCLCIRHVKRGGQWAGRIESQLELAMDSGQVQQIREAFNALRQPVALRCAAEVLRESGVLNRSRWPLTSTSLALLAVMALRPLDPDSIEYGMQKSKFRQWWWARTLDGAATGRDPGLQDLFTELEQLTRDPEWRPPELVARFADCARPVNLAARRAGQARSGQSLARLVECLLRLRAPRDFAAGVVPADGAMDLHHLFPRHWGVQRGIDVDVLANLALLAPHTNRRLIGKKGPREFSEELLRGKTPEVHEQFWSVLRRDHGIDRTAYFDENFESFIRERVAWFDSQLALIRSGA